MKLEKLLTESLDEMGDQHQGSSKETPLRPDAFDMSNTEKVLQIEEKNSGSTACFGNGSYRRQSKRHPQKGS